MMLSCLIEMRARMWRRISSDQLPQLSWVQEPYCQQDLLAPVNVKDFATWLGLLQLARNTHQNNF
jgi:hypothetical protein